MDKTGKGDNRGNSRPFADERSLEKDCTSVVQRLSKSFKIYCIARHMKKSAVDKEVVMSLCTAHAISDPHRLLARAKQDAVALDMTRGKPSDEQLELSRPLLGMVDESDSLARDGVALANYGGLEGLMSMRQLFAEIFEVSPEQVLVGGNSSLTLEYLMLAQSMIFGVNDQAPISQQAEMPIWLCPVPGYDRHFAMTERFGFKLLPVPLTGRGIDLSVAAPLIESNSAVKGVWIVPRYSNPTGETYSQDTVEALAALKPAAPDFYYYIDHAYADLHIQLTI